MDFKEFIERVKERTDIEKIIRKYVNLDKNSKGKCPFHEDKNPSLSVNIKNKYFYCFGCGKGGDVFKFLELQTNRSFTDILYDLADKAGIEKPQIDNEYKKYYLNDRAIDNILTDTASFYHKNINSQIKQYLVTNRGLREELINKFQIGFAKGGLKDHLLYKCKYPEDLCIKSGVIKRKEDIKVIDTFYNRIIFPNTVNGRVVYLTGRNINDVEPKYLNLSRELSHLYNEDALNNNEVFIAEGIIDCLTLIGFGYSAVGIYGINNFKSFYKERFKSSHKVYICLDGDSSGRYASIGIAEALGDKAKIMVLPDGFDPNQFLLNNSVEEFEIIKELALDLIGYKIAQIPSDTKKIELPERIKPILTELSKMEKVKSDAYLNHNIKEKFSLKKYEINGYIKSVDSLRKEGLKIDQATGNKSIYTASFENLVDLVEYNGNPAFLVKEKDQLSVKNEIEIDGEIYIPPGRVQIPFLLPNADRVIEFYEISKQVPEYDLSLYNDLLDCFKGVSELPTEEFYQFIVSWIMHTYLLENFQYSPILCFFSLPERGKSRTGKSIIYTSYRGIRVESLREAYIVRISESFRGSIFFDIRDAWKKAISNNSEDILLNRFERGTKVPRVNNPDRGPFRDIDYYEIFGPTLIATNVAIDKILETRGLTINMPQSTKRFEEDIKESNLLPYKEKLLVFRAKHMGEVLPEVQKPAKGRLGDILRPILQIIMLVNPEAKGSFINLIRNVENRKKLENMDSTEAELVRTLVLLKEKVLNGKLSVKEINTTINDGKIEKFCVSSSYIGKKLSAMNFDKAKTGSGASAIIYDDDKIKKLADTYGIFSLEPSDTSVKKTTTSDATEMSEGKIRLF